MRLTSEAQCRELTVLTVAPGGLRGPYRAPLEWMVVCAEASPAGPMGRAQGCGVRLKSRTT